MPKKKYGGVPDESVIIKKAKEKLGKEGINITESTIGNMAQMTESLLKDPEFITAMRAKLKMMVSDPLVDADILKLFAKMLEISEKKETNYTEEFIERVKVEAKRGRHKK